MNSSQSNKYIMAFLATVFIAMTIGISSDAIFSTPHPETEGYAIVASEGGAPAAGKEAPAAVPIATLLASADPARGATVFKRCAACHTAEKGGANKVGPHLWDVVNRPVAEVSDFSYSASIKAFAEGGKVWDYDHLSHFLTSPKGYIKGTAMGFAGLKKDNERADLIAYLRSLSDNPAPLPSPEAAAPAEETKPAEEAKPAEEKPAEAPATQEPAKEAPAAPETPAPATPEAPAPQPAN